MITNWWLYIVSVGIWGSTWLAIDFQLGDVPVEVSLVYRFLLASVVLFGWCKLRGRNLHFDTRAHGYFLLLGLFLFGLNYIFAYSAQLYITSALNSIVFSAMIWMNILNARIFLGARIERRTYVGAALGVVSIVILFWPEVRHASWSDRTMIGAACSLAGAVLASFGNILSQYVQKLHVPVLQINAWAMLYGALVNVVFALLLGRQFVFDGSWRYVGSLLYLAVPGSVIAFGCYLTLIGRIGVARAGYVVVMVPVVAVVISVVFQGMEVQAHLLTGILFALAGNLIVVMRPRPRVRA